MRLFGVQTGNFILALPFRFTSDRITGTLVMFLDWTEGCIELHLSGLRPLPGARPWNVFHHPLNTGIASHMVSTQQAARGTFRHRSANFQHYNNRRLSTSSMHFNPSLPQEREAKCQVPSRYSYYCIRLFP